MATPLQRVKSGLRNIEPRILTFISRFAETEHKLVDQITQAILGEKLSSRRERTRRVREAIAILHRLDGFTESESRRIVREAFRLGGKVGGRSKLFEDSQYGRVNQEALSLLVTNMVGRLSESIQVVGRRVEDVYRREGLRIATSQLLAEKPTLEASEDLVRELRKEGVTGFSDSRGRGWRLSTYSEMVVRTTTSEAIAQGASAALQARGFDVVSVNKVIDPCPICTPYDGEEFSLTGVTPNFKLLDRLPPWHPNCRHFILPSPKAVELRRAA